MDKFWPYIYFIFIVPYTVFPILLYFFVTKKARTTYAFILNSIILIAYSYILYNIVNWQSYGTIYMKFFFILISLFAWSYSLNKHLKQQAKHIPSCLFRLFNFFKLLIAIVLLFVIYKHLNPHKKAEIDLDFPLKNGCYMIGRGGNNYLMNTHGLDLKDSHGLHHQRYACDIVKLNKYGRIWKGWKIPRKLDDFVSFKDTVYSPCNGKIIKVVDYMPDHPPLIYHKYKIHPANEVVIKKGRYHIVLLHLLKNSIIVEKGDSIKVGQPIGLIGNSGMSELPHLHIHAYDAPRIIFNSATISFNGKIPMKNYIFCP